jgi:acyl-CoA hydrolase
VTELIPAGKPVSASATHDHTELIFPNDLNAMGTVYGGRVLDQADRVAAVVAIRHAGRVCVTLGLDSVRFLTPAARGDILVFKASVNRTWRTSMEVGVKVFTENVLTHAHVHVFSAYLTFVAVDANMRPTPVPPVIPQTEDEKRRYAQADARRQHRLQQRGRK